MHYCKPYKQQIYDLKYIYSMTVKEELIKTVRVIIRKTRITKLKIFFNIYGSLLIQIFDKEQPNQGMYVRKYVNKCHNN